MNTLDILIARESDLETAHLIHAAKRGLLPDLLTAAKEIIEAANGTRYGVDWDAIWQAHTDAGHPEPEYQHTSNDDCHDEGGTVWGIDTLSAFGATHEVGWAGCYGGEHGGAQFGWGGERHDEWGVWEDGTGVSRNECLAAMAEHYGIDMTDGQPAEPDIDDCEQDKNAAQTVHVVMENGELEEVGIYRYSHPKESLSSGSYGPDDEDIDPDDSPFPHYYSAEELIDDQHDSVRDVIRALQNADGVHSVHDDEEEAEIAQLNMLANLATDEHGTPEHYDLYQPDGAAPYLLPLDGQDVEEDRYHLDADEWRNVIDTGWVALTDTLAEAWGKRAMLAALKDRRDQAEAILATRPHTIWVSLASSYGAGNCRQGTAAFLRRHDIDSGAVGAIRADALLELEPANSFVRHACQLAALGIH